MATCTECISIPLNKLINVTINIQTLRISKLIQSMIRSLVLMVMVNSRSSSGMTIEKALFTFPIHARTTNSQLNQELCECLIPISQHPDPWLRRPLAFIIVNKCSLSVISAMEHAIAYISNLFLMLYPLTSTLKNTNNTYVPGLRPLSINGKWKHLASQ